MKDTITVPQQEPGNVRTKKVYMTVKLAENWIASDHTGAFPRVSSRGNRYISLLYIYDANYIKRMPVKSRHRHDLLGAYKEVYKFCEKRGFKPELHRMDNETSEEVEEFIQDQNAQIQCSTPDRHCRPAERALQTYKSGFKSVVYSLPKHFPIALWDRLTLQTDL